MRAEPYRFEDSGAPKQKTGFSNQFKNAGQAEPQEKTAKMSSGFNRAANNNSSKSTNAPDSEPPLKP